MININDVSKTYFPNTSKENKVLDKASLELPDKGFVFIVGKSGIGKSTILNAIGGLISYDGEILFNNKKEDIEEFRRKNISYIFQDFLLFDELSVKDNIRIALNINGIYEDKEIIRRATILLKAVGLKISLNRNVSALSLGQRQRVAIARGLASNPSIILADEPTGNLDSKNSLKVMDILSNLSKDRLVICVTHNINLVHLYADKAFAIIDKKFKEVDPKESSLDLEYASSQLSVSNMSEKDFVNGKLIIRLFSSSEEEQGEINIISDKGKIVVVGDNVEVSNNDIIIPKKAEYEKEEKLNEDVNLHFETVNQKKPFKESAFVQALSHFFSFRKEKGQKSRVFSKIMELIIPFIIFLLLDSLFLSLAQIDEKDNPGQLAKSEIILVPDSQASKTKLTTQQIYDALSDDSSYLIDTPISTSSDEIGLSTGVSANEMTVYSDIVNYDSSLFPTRFKVTLSDVSKYSKLPVMNSLLSPYLSLKDDEVVMDKSYFSGSLDTITYSGLPLYDDIIGTYVLVPKSSYTSYTSYFKFKIVGLVDSGYKTFFANSATCESFKLEHAFSTQTLYNFNRPETLQYLEYPDLSNFIIENYDDAVSDPDIKIESTGTSIDETSFYKNSYSLSAPIGICSTTALSTFFSSSYSSFESVLQVRSDYKATYLKDESKPVLLLMNYKYGTSTIDSSNLFFAYYLSSCMRYNSSYTVPDNLNITEGEGTIDNPNEIIVPSSLVDKVSSSESLINIVSKMLTINSQDLQIKGIYSSDDVSSPIYCSSAAYYYLSNPSEYSVVDYDSSNISPLENAYINSLRIFSSDVNKTEKYFQTKYSDYGLKAYTVYEAYEKTIRVTYVNEAYGLIISIASLSGIMIAILILDNISRINQDKRRLGILRCLGMKKKQIIGDDFVTNSINSFLSCFLSSFISLIFLSIFHLYFMGWYYLLFIIGYVVISLLSSEIPMILVLRKKPNDIMRTLS